jgi:hypothetical protein
VTITTWPTEPFARSDLTRFGHDEAALLRALRAGDVRAVVRGMYVAAEVADTVELRVAAVARLASPHHVVTDRTAAWLWGVDTYAASERAENRAIEACALRWNEPTCVDGVDGRTRDLWPQDVTTLHGVRVTTPLRTALDLGCHLRRREAYAAMNELARAHGLARPDLERAMVRFRRRRGVVQLRELVGLADPRVESPRESWVLLAIHDASLPLPEPQVWVEVDDVATWRLDFAYREQRIAVEYDGHEHHLLTTEQREHDATRRGWLREHGWRVIVVRRGDFTDQALYRWTGSLRELLASSYTTRRW